MPDASVNLLSILLVTIIGMGIGAMWYGPLFGKHWMQLVGKTEEDIKNGGSTGYIIAAVGQFVMAFVLAHVIRYAGADTWLMGAQTGLWMWVGFVATTAGINSAFADRSWKLFAIDMGYHLVLLLEMGAIIAFWR